MSRTFQRFGRTSDCEFSKERPASAVIGVVIPKVSDRPFAGSAGFETRDAFRSIV